MSKPDLVPEFPPDPAIHGDDFSPPMITARHAVANEVAEVVRELELARVYGGEAKRHESGKCYTVGISIPRTLDGQVSVYGKDYLLVAWTFAGAQAPLPYNGTRLLGSVADVREFLRLAFTAHDGAAAMAIPERVAKRRGRKSDPVSGIDMTDLPF